MAYVFPHNLLLIHMKLYRKFRLSYDFNWFIGSWEVLYSLTVVGCPVVSISKLGKKSGPMQFIFILYKCDRTSSYHMIQSYILHSYQIYYYSGLNKMVWIWIILKFPTFISANVPVLINCARFTKTIFPNRFACENVFRSAIQLQLGIT